MLVGGGLRQDQALCSAFEVAVEHKTHRKLRPRGLRRALFECNRE
jgi:hypothetical protein